ncbi:uncharacterized protein LOC106157127 isoform X2 [Lingula anatina]|uniref:Uncharacterized protein LOC106157127 isoform X2 n=1 Tax=Lingula anatina TaxID=7574 RepID=A0A1S3HSQ6_LINAN|nr:uncharacterized protein LOC106157127 isoform X2 [Lingula anatina]|eukprot:XP_013388089.1 uncharacterized protein LOC106157127 isoform X2 [Lingula anatina]
MWLQYLFLACFCWFKGVRCAGVNSFDVSCGTGTSSQWGISYSGADAAQVYADGKAATCNFTEEFDTSTGVTRYYFSNIHQNNGVDCGRKKHGNAEIYSVNIVVQESANTRVVSDQVYTITCPYIVTGQGSSNNPATITIGQSSTIPKVEPGAALASGTLDLTVVDAQNATVTSVVLGHPIRLLAIYKNNAPAEQGLMVIGCEARDAQPFTLQHFFLVAGCGQGDVIKSNEGFTTVGYESISPFFKAFAFTQKNTILFACDFALCPIAGRCDGSSCTPVGRRKRSLVNSTMVTSQPVRILSSGDYASSQFCQNQSEKSSMCFQSIGFIISMTVLGCIIVILFVIVTVLTIRYFRSRPNTTKSVKKSRDSRSRPRSVQRTV